MRTKARFKWLVKAAQGLGVLMLCQCQYPGDTQHRVSISIGTATAAEASEPGKGLVAEGAATPGEQAANPAGMDEMAVDVKAASEAAARDFPRFLSASWKNRTRYGFRAEDEQDKVSLAAPVVVYSIDASIAARMKEGDAPETFVEPAGECMFPVKAGEEYRTLFGARLLKDGWKGVYLGNPNLAAVLQGIRRAWSTEERDAFVLVSSVQPRAFFFIALNTGRPNLTPITGMTLPNGEAIKAPADWKSVTPAGAVLEFLKRARDEGAADGVPLESTGQVSETSGNEDGDKTTGAGR